MYPTSGNVQKPLEGEKVAKARGFFVMDFAHPYYIPSSLEVSLHAGEKT